MKIKKPTFDLLIKSIAMFVLMVLSVIGIVFGSIHIADNNNRGATYEGSVSTTVYFSPYEASATEGSQTHLDFTIKRNETDTKPIENVNQMLEDAAQVYAQRLYAQGFSQVTITQNENDKTAPKNAGDFFHNSWLIDNGLPSVTVTVNKLNPQDREQRLYTQRVLRQTLFEATRSFNLTLETTDGVQLISSASDEFIKDSVSATTPTGITANSSLTMELKLPVSSTINTNDDGAKNFIDSRVQEKKSDSDYLIGNGQSSVEKKLFSGTNGTTTEGNRNIVLWKDKESALFYVRYIFSLVKNENAYNSLSDTEKEFWKFLHREAPYDGSTEATKDISLNAAFKDVSDIQLDHLYYLYAVPKAYVGNEEASTIDETTDGEEAGPTEVSSPNETRSSRGGSTDFSTLFAPYVLYEARTTNIDKTQNETLTSIFPINQQFNHGGNAKMVISEVLKDTGSYASLTFSEANTLVQLIKNGSFATSTAIVAGHSVDNPAIMTATIPEIDAFGTSMLALGIFLLLVGIIVSVLYKIPGLLSFLPILLSGILSILLYTVFGGILDLFTLFGWLAITSVGVGCNLLVNETFRRNIRNSTSIPEASRLAYKHTFMKIADVHILMLILGLFLTYLGRYQESSFGILLIVGSFNSFFVTYGVSTILTKLFMSMNNWMNYKYFVYKRDAQWLNEISGQLVRADGSAELNAAVNHDAELTNLFKQSYKADFFSKRFKLLLSAWIIVVVVGIISLTLFGLGIVWPISATVQSSGFNIFISCLSTMLIMAAYFATRYRWIVVLPYLLTSMVHFFICVSVIMSFTAGLNSQTEFENIFVLLLSWIVGQVGIVFAISWNFNYWYSHVIYGSNALNRLLNNNLISSVRLFAIFTSIMPVGFILLAALNFGGEQLGLVDSINTFMFAIVGMVVVNAILIGLATLTLFNQLLGINMQWRQVLMERRKKIIKAHEHKNYDRIDEQIIPGINQKISERRF